MDGGKREGEFYAGVDLGTAYIVTAVVDSDGVPVAGAITRSLSSIRDGLVLDYLGAIRFLQKQVAAVVTPDSTSRLPKLPILREPWAPMPELLRTYWRRRIWTSPA